VNDQHIISYNVYIHVYWPIICLRTFEPQSGFGDRVTGSVRGRTFDFALVRVLGLVYVQSADAVIGVHPLPSVAEQLETVFVPTDFRRRRAFEFHYEFHLQNARVDRYTNGISILKTNGYSLLIRSVSVRFSRDTKQRSTKHISYMGSRYTDLIVFQRDAVVYAANEYRRHDGRPVHGHRDRVRDRARRRMSRRVHRLHSELITPSRLETAQRQLIVLDFARRGLDPMRRYGPAVFDDVSCAGTQQRSRLQYNCEFS